MNSLFRFFTQPPTGPASLFLVRLPVGLIFFTQGILKFTDPNMGVNRFTRIGFPHPAFTAHFVGCFEIVCGTLVLLGLRTRLSSVPLLIVISTAIATTKLPELARPNRGFWSAMHSPISLCSAASSSSSCKAAVPGPSVPEKARRCS